MHRLLAFVALVVCLTLVIIASCTAVIFLIRDQKAHDQGQAHRRPYHRTSGRHSSSYSYTNGPASKSWRARLATFFGRRGVNANSQVRPDMKMKGSSDHGWVQASLDDDWEVDLVEERRKMAAHLEAREGSSLISPSVTSVPSMIHPPVSRSNSDSTSSVRFDLSPVRGMTSYDRHPSPHPTLPNIHSQLSSPSSSPAPSPIRVGSPEPITRGTTPDSSRQFIPPPSVRTFPGGSRFIEGL